MLSNANNGPPAHGRRPGGHNSVLGDEEPPAPRCMVLGYERNDSSRRAAAWAVDQLLPDGRLVIVHACRALNAPAWPLSSSHEREQLGRAVVDELLLSSENTLRDLDLEVEVLDVDPASALIDAAERHRADAIVIGCEPHSRLHRALGVLTDELLERSPVPVVAIPRAVAHAARTRA